MSKRNRKINNQKHQKGLRQEKQLTRHQQHTQAIKELHSMFTQHVNVLYNRLTSQGLVTEAILDYLDETGVVSKQDMINRISMYAKNTNIYNAMLRFNNEFLEKKENKDKVLEPKTIADKMFEVFQQNKMETIEDFDDDRIRLKEIFPNQYEDAMTIFKNLVEENIEEIGNDKYLKDEEEGTTDES